MNIWDGEVDFLLVASNPPVLSPASSFSRSPLSLEPAATPTD